MVILDINALLPYIFLAYLVVIVVYLILDNRSPQSTLAWLIIIAALPVVGLFFYIFFGRNSRRISRRKKRNRAYVEEQLFDVLQPFSKGLEREEKILDKHITHSQKGELATLFYRNSQALLTSRNKIKIFDNGKEKFDALIRDLEKARHSIHLEYFIWRSDTPVSYTHLTLPTSG